MPSSEFRVDILYLPLKRASRKRKSFGSGGSMVAKLKLKGIDGRSPPELFHDLVDGGAWPFLVRGLICLVNSDNERDWSLIK
uniref:Uncharacterized protein n=1 Tax=Panagrolaimus sp. ES5 TaxID=591445 RepID=A0AC34GBY6_9BILA